tara:strand:- start:20 stop:247 length:228 start_codon:yes stop_codon:yes gene_type:complete
MRQRFILKKEPIYTKPTIGKLETACPVRRNDCAGKIGDFVLLIYTTLNNQDGCITILNNSPQNTRKTLSAYYYMV